MSWTCVNCDERRGRSGPLPPGWAASGARAYRDAGRKLMSESPTLHGWRALLERQGHRVVEPDLETVTGFSLSPAADTRVTVAVDPDGLLYPQFRQRFFLCEPEPEQVFRVLGCPEPYRTRWLELVLQQ